MPIGSANGIADARRPGSPLKRTCRLAYARLYGCSDVHTHVRWRAVRGAVPVVPTLLDVGSGDGMLTIEVARRNPAMSVRGLDLDPVAVANAEQARSAIELGNVSFEVADVMALDLPSVDAALLIDIIEHVDDDAALIEHVGRAIEPGGRLVISTPTPNFPRFFGREFHNAVGHVRDGYTPDDLAPLLAKAGFAVESTSYYTRFPASLVCAVFYRYLWRNKAGVLLSPLLSALSRLDVLWPSRRGASSLLVVATKPDES
jgi:SAM-dependent methyltransferase